MVATVENKRRKTSRARACRQNTRLTAADVQRVMKGSVRSKKAAEEFLKSIGVTFDKDGNSVVTPL